MSQTLYRKYRPKNFSEIVGQKHIVKTLVNAVKNNRVGQAYLFTGPRGTGKTSVARILAKTVNCEKIKGAATCEQCSSCQMINGGRALDIIEIDAASHTGVENIRELRETIAFPPTALKYKVYIIDEVHMLSTGAFNALLKTLEEPPAHVIFILATTEIHKVPETILSRCQRFDFARLPIQNLIEKLSLIAKAEKIKIDKDSLEMIAIAAEGGMRDAESLLGQIIALEDKNITLKETGEILGTTDRKFASEMAEMLISNETNRAISKINSLLTEGYDLGVFNKLLINYLRQLMVIKVNPELKSLFSYEITGEQMEKMLLQAKRIEMPKIISAINLFLEAQNKIYSFMLPQLPLEIAIIKATGQFPISPAESGPRQGGGNKISNSKSQNIIEPDMPIVKKAEVQPENKNIESKQAGNLTVDIIQENWDNFLKEISPFNHSLKVLFSNCRIVSAEGSKAILATTYDFYKERLDEPANKLTAEQVFGKVLGTKISIEIIVRKENPAGKESDKKNSLIQSALEILGGKVVE